MIIASTLMPTCGLIIQLAKRFCDGVVATRYPYQSLMDPSSQSFDRNPKSLAYVPFDQTVSYYAGGFNGGKTESFMEMAVIANNVNKDLEKGVVALWHDESHMNRYLIDNPPALQLTPTYCYAEEFYGTDYPDKNHCFEENHNELRS